MKHILSLLNFIIFIQFSVFGQIDKMDFIPTPQSVSLAKYVTIPVSYNTGIPEIDIPLYEIKVNDFSLPISLSYHASGIKVSQEATSVGLGWVLNAGGAIVRMKRGKRYDGFDVLPETDNKPRDFSNRKNYPQTTEDLKNNKGEYLSFPSSYYGSYTFHHPNYYIPNDAEPDIFCYNFGNYQGRFILDKKEGHIVPILLNPEQKIKIEILDIKVPGGRFSYPGKGFTITTPNGIKYHFYDTETFENLRYSQITPSPMSQNMSTFEPVDREFMVSWAYWIHEDVEASSWNLSSIELPNNEKITFSYHYRTIESPQYISRDRYFFLKKIDNPEIKFDNLNDFHLNRDTVVVHHQKIIYESLFLDRINWSSGKIIIECSNRVDLRTNSEKAALKIDKIVIKNENNIPIKSYFLHNSYFRKDKINDKKWSFLYTRLKLDSISIYGNNIQEVPLKYRFRYKEKEQMGAKNGNSDLWGFFNKELEDRNRDYISPIPFCYMKNGSEYRIKSKKTGKTYFYTLYKFGDVFGESDRSCDTMNIDTYTLTQIQYPTGSIRKFKYEPHRTFNRLYRGQNLNKDIYVGGGIRIKKIIDLTGITYFTYKLPNGKSSGYSPRTPCYQAYDLYKRFDCLFGGPVSIYCSKMISSVNQQSDVPTNYLAVEVVKNFNNKWKKERYYYSFSGSLSPFSENICYHPYEPNKEDNLLRSHILYETVNDSLSLVESKKIKEDFFTYNYFELGNYKILKPYTEDYNTLLDNYNSGFILNEYENFYNIKIGCSLPEKKETTYYYYNAQEPVKKTITIINEYDNLLLRKTKQLGNHVITKEYLYSTDINDGVYKQMSDENLIKPIEQVTYLDNKIVDATLSEYKKKNNMFNLSKTYTLNKKKNVTSFRFYDGINRDVNYKSYSDLEIKQYDNFGNIVGLKDYSNLSKVILWSYHKQFPVLKIYNSSLSSIYDVVSKKEIDFKLNGNPSNEVIRTLGQTLRQRLPKARITTMTYTPLVGMTSQTDPRGITTYYEYDTFNRLKRTYIIENGVQKTLETYTYHYKQN